MVIESSGKRSYLSLSTLRNDHTRHKPRKQYYHPSWRKVASAETTNEPGNPGTREPIKLGIYPETRTVRMLPVTPPGARMATLACFTMGSVWMAFGAPLTA